MKTAVSLIVLDLIISGTPSDALFDQAQVQGFLYKIGGVLHIEFKQ